MLGNRLRKNVRKLKKWVKREGVTCYRLYDRDIPEVPLCIDWYDGRLHIAEYKRRASPDGADHAPWLATLVDGAAAALEVAPERVFVKRRERQRGLSQYEKVAYGHQSFVVVEGGCRFRVNLSDYLDTGLFLDHRTTRALVAERAAGRRFLNLFAYTGSFSVYAAAAGAETTSVDLSNTYTAWARDNLKLNGLGDDKHRVVRADVMEWLDEQPAQAWDVVMVDPPTFSNSKRMDAAFDIQRDHTTLISACRRVVAPDGIIYFSSNYRKLRLEIDRAQELTPRTIPPDFRDRRIHRCWEVAP